jgi:hypothetical protein
MHPKLKQKYVLESFVLQGIQRHYFISAKYFIENPELIKVSTQ